MALPVSSISCCVSQHLTKRFTQRNAIAFNRDRCCHLALCLWLILFHWKFIKFSIRQSIRLKNWLCKTLFYDFCVLLKNSFHQTHLMTTFNINVALMNSGLLDNPPKIHLQTNKIGNRSWRIWRVWRIHLNRKNQKFLFIKHIWRSKKFD
jgi:hypothetical protein